MPKYKVGDQVIYRKPKSSVHPGPRAKDIQPAQHGEDYSYSVNKFWAVSEVEGDAVLIKTRTGKQHRLQVNDPYLRKANLLERLFRRDRFPKE